MGELESERAGTSQVRSETTVEAMLRLCQYTKIPAHHMQLIEENVFGDIPSKIAKLMLTFAKQAPKRSDGRAFTFVDFPRQEVDTKNRQITFLDTPRNHERTREFLSITLPKYFDENAAYKDE